MRSNGYNVCYNGVWSFCYGHMQRMCSMGMMHDSPVCVVYVIYEFESFKMKILRSIYFNFTSDKCYLFRSLFGIEINMHFIVNENIYFYFYGINSSKLMLISPGYYSHCMAITIMHSNLMIVFLVLVLFLFLMYVKTVDRSDDFYCVHLIHAQFHTHMCAVFYSASSISFSQF